MTDPNYAWEYILNRFVPVLDSMCPKRLFSIKNYRPEWVTDELIEQIKDRDYFYQTAKTTGDIDAWNIARHLRNRTNSNIRSAKREFILNEFEENKSDHKRFWKNIRRVMPDSKGDSRQEIRLTGDDGNVERHETAAFINDYFINVGKVPLDALQPIVGEEDDDGPGTDGPSEFLEFQRVTEREVYKFIKEINISKSSGLENISSFIIKETFKILLPKVTHLFNLSLTSSEFPQAWKDALVIPIPKTGDLSNVKNYRPISLLPIPGKILEKLVHTQLSKFIEDNGILSDIQHGFRKSHSTIHSVAQLVKYVNTNMDMGKPTLATYVDFRKAFDCVQHGRLLDKLRKSNLSKNVVDWIGSYLEHRRQRVLANNSLSGYQNVTQGVPQGSVLGPQLYILYANDLTDGLTQCKVAQYADDTVLYIANVNFTLSTRKMQADLGVLEEWCRGNGIMANTDKTKVMVFGSKKVLERLPEFDVTLNDTVLKQVKSYCYLGMKLDTQLNFDKHIQKTIRTVSNKLVQFKRMRSFMNNRVAILIYKSMFLPILEYGDTLLSSISVANKKRLQILQNKGLRCALKSDKYASSALLHSEAKLLKLKHRREIHLLNYMYDMSLNTWVLKFGTISLRTCTISQLKLNLKN